MDRQRHGAGHGERIWRTTYNLLDVPNSLANATDSAFSNYPDSDFTYDTLEFAFQKRFGKLFVQASADYQWRNELRSADVADVGSTSPLVDRSDRRLPADFGEPERTEPAEDDDVSRAGVGTVQVPVWKSAWA